MKFLNDIRRVLNTPLILVFLLYSVFFPGQVSRANDNPCDTALRELVEYAYFANTDAEASGRFFKYKNEPISPPRRVVLYDPNVPPEVARREIERLQIECATCGPYPPSVQTPPISVDHYRILSLRRGDKVVFHTKTGDREFTLGNFLGRGMATHVWEIADDPKHVLRIGFSASGDPENAGGGDNSVMVYSTWLLKDKRTPGVRRVEISERDPDFKYVVATKVNGDQTGRDFIMTDLERYMSARVRQRLPEQFKPQWMKEVEEKIARLLELEDKLNAEDYRKTVELVKSRGGNGSAVQRYEPSTVRVLRGTGKRFKNYLWDKDVRDWVEVDWE